MAKRKNSGVKSIIGTAKEAYENTIDKAVDAKKQGEKIIKENPFTSVVVAAAVGAVVALGTSMILSRKNTSFFDRLRDYF